MRMFEICGEVFDGLERYLRVVPIFVNAWQIHVWLPMRNAKWILTLHLLQELCSALLHISISKSHIPDWLQIHIQREKLCLNKILTFDSHLLTYLITETGHHQVNTRWIYTRQQHESWLRHFSSLRAKVTFYAGQHSDFEMFNFLFYAAAKRFLKVFCVFSSKTSDSAPSHLKRKERDGSDLFYGLLRSQSGPGQFKVWFLLDWPNVWERPLPLDFERASFST